MKTKALLILSILAGALLGAAIGCSPAQIQKFRENAKRGDSAAQYRKAAEQGDAVAQCNLGVCYYNGDGVPRDYTEAVRWFRKAAEQGNAGAQHNLGVCYAKGHGVPQDYTEAARWWR